MASTWTWPQYIPILGPKDIVTGVRGFSGNDVILTGSVVTEDNKTTCMIYVGPLPDTDRGVIFPMEPAFTDREITITGSTFYGPDTSAYNHNIQPGTIRAVGTYQYEGSEGRNHGVMYEGAPSGGGSWTPIDMPADVAGGEVANTVPHSTMGDLIVGNYDLIDDPGTANAFIYNCMAETWSKIELEGCTLTTAYGIWLNAIATNSYTIVGGTHDETGINQGLIVDYDSATGRFSNQTLYRNSEDPVVLTHFEGITKADDGGYNLAGQAKADKALFASVERTAQGFSDATYSPATYPQATKTTGNTVFENILMGICEVPGSEVQSYAAIYPPDQRSAKIGRAIRAVARAARAERAGLRPTMSAT